MCTQPDFITCDDGWFRPVDVKLGPDGALYIADFYNAVIGHYEVPLQHPRRDRERGRIWRVVYVGATSTTDASLTATATTSTTVIAVPSLKNLSAAELIERLGDANFTTRTLATNEYVDRIGTAGVPAILELLRGESSPEQRANGLWIVSRLAGPESLPINTLVDDPSPMVRTHLARVLGEMPAWQMPQREATLKLLHDSQPIVQRAAADAIGRHPEMSQVRPLLQLLNNSPAGDTHLRHTLRMSLRDHLADDEIVRTVSSQLTEGERKMLAPLALGVRRMGAAAVELVADSLAVEPNIEQRLALSGYSVRYVARDRMEHVLHKIAQSTEVDLPLLRALQNSMRQRGDGSERELSPWAERLAVDLLSQPVTSRIRWHYETLDGKSDVESRFGIDRRRTADGAENVEFYCSFPRGENGTGVYRSEPFRMPETLSFYVVGHDGAPDQAAHGKNVVRLVANSSRATLLEVAAPRNDVAQRVEWKRPVSADEPVSIEIIDRNSSGSYAWIGAGRFSLESLNPQPVDPFTEGLALVSEFRIVAMREHLVTRLKDKSISINDRMACLRTLNSLSPEPRIAAMLSSRVSFPLSDTSIDQLTKGVVSGDIPAIDKLLEQTLRAGSATAQGALAYELAGSRIGASSLLSLVEQGVASRRLLLDAKLRDRLQAVGLPEVNERIAKLTEGLSPVSAEVANLLAARQLGFANWRTSYVSDLTDDKRELALMRGREVFKKTCAVCHQIGGEGAKIGPQLDGVGHRGFARILEDLIDPNRNVDAAFRSSTLVMTDGKVVTGLVRREEGATLVLADEKGKEFSVLLSEIELRKTSELSLMPEKLGESISEQDLYSLLLFLTQPTVTTPEVVP
ncbi:MAG: HEAT repeat domain-containing protein [Planctomycetaceae bacterium]